MTHSFCCVYEEDNTIWDPDTRCDLVREVNVAFEGDTKFSIIFCYKSKHIRNQSIRQPQNNTWCIHDIEKVRFASGVWQDHCDRGTLDTNSPLWKNSTKKRSFMQHKKNKSIILILVFLKLSFLATRSCNHPSLKQKVKVVKLTVCIMDHSSMFTIPCCSNVS